MKTLPLIAGASLLITSCMTTNPYTGERQVSKTTAGAGIGAAGGALLGAIIGNNVGDGNKKGDARQGAVVGALIGGALGGGIGNYMDRQEAEIRQQLQSTGVSVTRQGNDIILNMPHDITFDVARDELRPEFANTLNSVAIVLNKYNQTTVTVDGHTDWDGGTAYNQGLSERRAQRVANYLTSQRVNPQRFVVRGHGEAYPIADNNTSQGKALNRRVELRIAPQQQAQ